MPLFFALDAGTTSMKVAVFNELGYQVAFERLEYTLLTPAPAMVELEAETYWQAAVAGVQKILAQGYIRQAEVISLCISSQGETFVPVNKAGIPLQRALVWLDNRAASEASQIARYFSEKYIFEQTGQPNVAPTWPACKYLWLKNNRPEVFYQTHKFLLLEDYLLYRLTGQFVTETSLQTSSLLLNLHTKTWWPEMLDFLGIPPEKFGTLCTPGQVIGPLSPQASAELGLSTKTLVVAGSMDQVSASLGAGNIYPGMTTESTGGAMGIVVTLQHPVFDPRRQIPCHVHALPEQYCVLAWGQTAGMALRWFRDQFYTLEAEQALQAQLDPYDYLTARAAEIAAGCDGLLALPHLEGAACPEFDPDARAVFFGATLRHTRAHFTRAILEAVAYMLKKNLDSVATLLEQPISELRCLGGGARSSLWMQIKADVLQKPVQTVRVEEAACLGAAILGAVACGVFSNYSEAVASMVHTQMSIWPNPNNRQVYAQGYAHYNQLYERLQPLFSQK